MKSPRGVGRESNKNKNNSKSKTNHMQVTMQLEKDNMRSSKRAPRIPLQRCAIRMKQIRYQFAYGCHNLSKSLLPERLHRFLSQTSIATEAMPMNSIT